MGVGGAFILVMSENSFQISASRRGKKCVFSTVFELAMMVGIVGYVDGASYSDVLGSNFTPPLQMPLWLSHEVSCDTRRTFDHGYTRGSWLG